MWDKCKYNHTQQINEDTTIVEEKEGFISKDRTELKVCVSSFHSDTFLRKDWEIHALANHPEYEVLYIEENAS